MYAATTSAAFNGAEPRAVTVEAHIGRNQESFRLTGLPDTAIREAKDRIRAAMACTGLDFPTKAVTVNLAPAELSKEGAAYDLPIALGILAATRQVPAASRAVATGELALDGTIRPASTSLAAAMVARRLKLPCLMAPDDAAVAQGLEGLDLRPVSTLAEAVAVARGGSTSVVVPPLETKVDTMPDLADVRGQEAARRALEISAAGGHHLLLVGPPGAGKSMLAKRLPGILPPLDPDGIVDVSCIWAAAGLRRQLESSPPYRSPHHNTSMSALIGGGQGRPRPGEISLAHRGALFLDEIPEFPKRCLDGLRQPLEDGTVTIARASSSIRFPCDVQLIAAANPCPCGWEGDYKKACRCRPEAVARYRRVLSGPLLDRIDIVAWVPRVETRLFMGAPGESSSVVAKRVRVARETSGRSQLNRTLSRRNLDELPEEGAVKTTVASALDDGRITARGAEKLRRVGRTIAELDGREIVTVDDLSEAMTLRQRQ